MDKSRISAMLVSCTLVGTLCGCQAVPDNLSTNLSRALDHATQMEEDSRKEYEAAVKDYEESMPRSLALCDEISSALYDGDALVDYNDFLSRVSHVRGDRESLRRVGDAMDAGFFVSSSSGDTPDFRTAGLASVVHTALFTVESLNIDGDFDWNAADAASIAQSRYDDLRAMHSSRDALASKLVFFQNMATEAELDESAYAAVVARDDAVVDVCVAEFEHICADHGIVLSASDSE